MHEFEYNEFRRLKAECWIKVYATAIADPDTTYKDCANRANTAVDQFEERFYDLYSTE